MSNHLQMKLKRLQFLLSYFKIPSVDPSAVQKLDLPHDSPMLKQFHGAITSYRGNASFS